MPRASIAVCAVITIIAASISTRAADFMPPIALPAQACIAIVMPTVEGMPGNAADLAVGVRDLIVSYLNGPSTKVVPLEARLASQAIEEARQKGCEPLLFASVTRKPGGSKLTNALGQAAGNTSWYLPGGGSAASATAHAAATGALQAISSLAGSTRAKDEVRLEYRLQSAAGQVQFGPKTETQKASADGEDLLTPVVRRAAEAIVTSTEGK